MSVTKTNFYSQQLNAFAPNRVRGELMDWGLNAMQMEVEIDSTVSGSVYAGDAVKIVSTSTGKLKVVPITQSDAAFGFVLFNPKKEAYVAGDICTILVKDGVLNCVTEDAIDAGVSVYFKVTDGSITKTQPSNGVVIGKTVEKIASGVSGGTFIKVLIG